MRLTTTAELLPLLPRDENPGAWASAFARKDAVDDPVAGFALINYLILTERRGADSLGLSAHEVFWNRYYWFHIVVLLRESRFGSDAGLEQAEFSILELCELNDPDWSNLELVESWARSAAAAIIAAQA